MTLLLLIVAAICLLGGLLGISISLVDLDRKLAELSKVMDLRYGGWIENRAKEKSLVKDQEKKGSEIDPTKGKPFNQAKAKK